MKIAEIKKTELLYMNIGGMYVAKIVGSSLRGVDDLDKIGKISGAFCSTNNIGEVSPKREVK